MDRQSSSRSPKSHSWKEYRSTLLLAYQSFGVVYGDLTISPLYVYKSTFSGNLRPRDDEAEVFGVLSLVFWSLTLIPLCKYIIFVLAADDNGEGGTIALYSLMCRKSKMRPPGSPQAGDEHLPAASGRQTRTSLLVMNFFEKHQAPQVLLFLLVLLGTGMVIGDGILTPSMSVLSAVCGLRIKAPTMDEKYSVLLCCVILVGLFAMQHYGGHRVGPLFAPILIAWLGCISGLGIYNILKWNPSIVRALSPYYVFSFFKKAGWDGWRSLGGVLLCITGAEAMFADLGHFSKLSIRVAFTVVVYPCLVVAYMGEAAYLSMHPEEPQCVFFKTIPDGAFWPVFILAIPATVAGCQAIISATFSMISQCRASGCFPRVKIIHTSSSIHGQIYIPEVNWLLMVLCLAVTIAFRDTEVIGNAYGLSVIIVMFVTTCVMLLIITTVWKQSIFVALLFFLAFGSLELLYLSACLAKITHGGWLPLSFSLAILLVMSAWHHGKAKKETFEVQNKVSLDQILSLGLHRLPGIGLVYSNVTTGVPPMLARFVTNFPALHRILIFVNLQRLTVSKVPIEERFLIRRIGPPEHRLFQCFVRYGFKDGPKDSTEFEDQLLMKVVEYLQQERSDSRVEGKMSVVVGMPSNLVVDAAAAGPGRAEGRKKRVRFAEVAGREDVRAEVKELLEEREAGVSYIMGHTYVAAHQSSTFVNKLVIRFYGFLRRNSRSPAVALGIPPASLVEVGVVYPV